jgi:hypothetical protein
MSESHPGAQCIGEVISSQHKKRRFALEHSTRPSQSSHDDAVLLMLFLVRPA